MDQFVELTEADYKRPVAQCNQVQIVFFYLINYPELQCGVALTG